MFRHLIRRFQAFFRRMRADHRSLERLAERNQMERDMEALRISGL